MATALFFYSQAREESKLGEESDPDQMIELFNDHVLPHEVEYAEDLPRQGPRAKPEIRAREYWAILQFDNPVVSTPCGSSLIGA